MTFVQVCCIQWSGVRHTCIALMFCGTLMEMQKALTLPALITHSMEVLEVTPSLYHDRLPSESQHA